MRLSIIIISLTLAGQAGAQSVDQYADIVKLDSREKHFRYHLFMSAKDRAWLLHVAKAIRLKKLPTDYSILLFVHRNSFLFDAEKVQPLIAELDRQTGFDTLVKLMGISPGSQPNARVLFCSLEPGLRPRIVELAKQLSTTPPEQWREKLGKDGANLVSSYKSLFGLGY